MKRMKSSFPCLRVQVKMNEIGRSEHSFFSVLLKLKFLFPPKLWGMWGNGIRFNEFFTKTLKIALYIQPFYFKM